MPYEEKSGWEVQQILSNVENTFYKSTISGSIVGDARLCKIDEGSSNHEKEHGLHNKRFS